MAVKSKDDLVKALEALSAETPAPDHTEETHEPSKRPESLGRPASPLSVQPATQATSPRAPAPPVQKNRPVAARSLELQRTMIPILLTLAVTLPVAGIVCLLMGDESPLGDQTLMPLAMVVTGVLIAAAAILTMLQVRHALTAKPAR
jgi:hypothetical protein